MKDLLKLEFFKLRRQKSFYICTVVMLALVFFALLLTKSLSNLLSEEELLFMTLPTGADLLVTAAYESSFPLVAGIFAILFITEDYDLQTVRNIYSRGHSKLSVYFAKGIAVLAAVSAMFVIVSVFAFISGSVVFSAGTVTAKHVGIVAVQYLCSVGEVSVAFLLAMLIRKNGAAIAAFIFMPLGVELIISISDILITVPEFTLDKFWVMSFIGDVTLDIKTPRLLGCIFGSLAYVTAFTLIGAFFSRKRDT